MTAVTRFSPRRHGLAARLALLTAPALIALCGCGGSSDGDATAGTDAEQVGRVGKITNVSVLELEPQSFASTIHITGVVEATHDAVVSAEEGGVLRRFMVEKGASVKAGQAIAKLDDRLLRSQVKEAEAAAALAQETYERRERLWKEEKVGSEITYLQSRHEADRMNAMVEGLHTRLARTTIKAPFDGIFDDDYLDVGEMAAPGTPIARIIGTEHLRITGGVPERYSRDVSSSTVARVSFDVLPGVEIETPVSFVGSAISEASRTFTVELRIDDPPDFIKPAMIANIDLVRQELDGVLVIPQSAVSRTEHGYQVFVVEDREQGLVAAARPVELGISSSNRVVVDSGLEPGDRIITSGKIDDGDSVRLPTPVNEDPS